MKKAKKSKRAIAPKKGNKVDITPKKKKINSRAKGAAAERELANYLKAKGIAARRGQQFSGSPDSPDVVADIPGWHIECKRVENFSLYPALAQANRDKPKGHRPVVVHRRNGQKWVAIIELDHFIDLISAPKAEKGRFEAEQVMLKLEQGGVAKGLEAPGTSSHTTPEVKRAHNESQKAKKSEKTVDFMD